MNAQQRIDNARLEIKAAEAEQKNCNHDFKPAIFDPETVKEGYGRKQVGKGSDPWWDFEGYRDVEKPRWSRECRYCGVKEYTYEREPIVAGYQPKF